MNNLDDVNRSVNNENHLAKSIRSKLIDYSIAAANDIIVLDQKLIVSNLQNYSGKYFQNVNNNCAIRCFNKTPNLLAVICEYTFDTEIDDADNVEILLKNSLSKMGYTIIPI